jgi:tetratricopeptide (TPR) repeat protein
MLESILAFVTERVAPERARQLRQAHRAHMLAQALACQARGDGALPEPQRQNAAEALRTAVADAEPELALSLALALRGLWHSVGIAPELLSLLDSALAQLPAEASVGAPAAVMLALLHLSAGHGAQARERAAQALDRAAPDSAARALALCARVRIAFEIDRQTTGLHGLLDEAEALAVHVGAASVEADVLGLRGMVALRHGKDPAAAERLLQRAADHHLALGQPREAWRLRYERACCVAMQGRREQGLAEARACEKAFELIGDRHHRLGAINLQGVLHSQRREWALALQAYRRCAADAWRSHNHFWLAYALWNHGRNLARLRQPEAAAQLMAFSESHWTRHFGALDQGDRRFVRVVQRLVRYQIGSAAADLAWQQGQRLGLPQALALALSLGDALQA